MKITNKQVIAVCLTLTLMNGCAGIENDSDRTRAEGTGMGAAVGAGLGALLGQAIGGDTEATILGAAIGGAVGAAGGYMYGDHVAGQKEKYASQEDWLDACIAEAKQSNREIRDYNLQLSEDIAALEKSNATLQKSYSSQSDKKKQMLAQKNKADSLLKNAQAELEEAKHALGAQETVVADAKQSGQNDYAKTLDSELAAMRKNIKELERRTEALASFSASMSV